MKRERRKRGVKNRRGSCRRRRLCGALFPCSLYTFMEKYIFDT
jgi:hypothetical protein